MDLLGLSLGDTSRNGLGFYFLAPAILFGPLVAEYLDGDLWFQRLSFGEWGVGSWGLIEYRNYVVVRLPLLRFALMPFHLFCDSNWTPGFVHIRSLCRFSSAFLVTTRWRG